MKISEIKSILDAELICGEEFIENEVFTACGSDMMSDVLAYVKEQAVLLSGLVNPQVVRTAEMMDMKCIVFVRGKRPDIDMIELAEQRDIVLLGTRLEMFTACGLLYKNGLKGGSGI
jgi:predicted transcriptional regulator